MPRAGLIALMGRKPSPTGGQFFSDDFNRADESSPIAGYINLTELAGFRIVSQQVAPNSGNTGVADFAVWATPCDTDDQFSQITITNYTSLTALCGPLVAFDPDAPNLSGYALQMERQSGNPEWRIVEYDGIGGSTVIGNADVGQAPGDVGRLELVDGTLYVYRNGDLQFTAPAGTRTGRHVGFTGARGAQTRMDDWYGGDL